MKIIDKNKDYYDYLQGVWGQDPKAVYMRQGSIVFSSENRPPFMVKELPEDVHAYQGYVVLTSGFVEHYIFVENTRDGICLEVFFKRTITRPGDNPPLLLQCYVTCWQKHCPKYYAQNWRRMPSKEQYIKQVLNHLSNPNGYRFFYSYSGTINTYYENPILMSFPLTIVPAEDVFFGIQDYLLSQYDCEITDKRTDIEKLEAAGFDRKTSFRNTK